MSFGQSQNQNASSNNWRNPKRLSSPPNFAGYQMQQQAMQQQLQQQFQLQLQLEAIQMQNREIQERLAAAMRVNDGRGSSPGLDSEMAAPTRPRPSSMIYDSPPMPPSSIDSDQAKARRKGALLHLQRVAQNRSSSPDSDAGLPSPGLPFPSTNRLSFSGDGLAERAMNRRIASINNDVDHVKPLHRRNKSSVSSIDSPLLSETHKEIKSPSGPTLVLSQPGDDYPSPTLGKGRTRSRQELVKRQGSDSTSGPDSSDSTPSSPRTPDSLAGARFSLDPSLGFVMPQQVDELGSAPFDHEAIRKVTSAARLNPSAPTFSPHPSQLGHGRPGKRIVSAPPALVVNGQAVIKPYRQPRGPCPDEELSRLNFSGRVRARAIQTLAHSRGQRSTPPSPTASFHSVSS